MQNHRTISILAGIIFHGLLVFSCKPEKEKQEYLIFQSKDRIDTIYLDNENDSSVILFREFDKLMKDSTYLPNMSFGKVPPNDTIFNDFGEPEKVTMGDEFFGAKYQYFEYNEEGKIKEITGKATDGIVKPYSFNIAISKYLYDDKGRLFEIRCFKNETEFISPDFETTPITRYIYDENDRVVELWFMDGEGELQKEFAIAKFDYDSGNQKLIGWFDKEGNKGELN